MSENDNNGRVPVTRAFGTYTHGQMHYRIARPAREDKTPFMCLHMSPSSSWIYRNLISHMGTDRIAVAPDTPGFGESDVPPEPLEIEDFAKANLGLLDQLGISGPVDVMGYHTGSSTACEMARQAPDRVRRLVLVSTAIKTEQEREEMRAHYGPKEIKEDGSHFMDTWRGIRRWSDPKQPLDWAMGSFAEHFRGGTDAWWGHRAAFNYTLADVLPNLDQQILVLNPEDDLHHMTLRAAPMLKNGRVHELPGWSHGFIDIYTDEVVELLRGFLD